MNKFQKVILGKMPKPSKRVVAILAIVIVVLLAALAAGYAQASRAADSINHQIEETTRSTNQLIESSTRVINSSETSTEDAVAELERAGKEVSGLAGTCFTQDEPLTGFLSADYARNKDYCIEYSASVVDLADAVEAFAERARFLAALNSAIDPALKAAPGGATADPQKVIGAWQSAEKSLAQIENVPEEAKSAADKLKAIANEIITQVKAVQSAQTNRDIAAFEKASKALTKQYASLNETGNELQSWLVDEQEKLLNAVERLRS
jgi:hypothetical protein